MRVVLAGKGGSGKTTIAATVARLCAGRGGRVVAVDADSNPNLAAALGVESGSGAAKYLSASVVSRRLDGPALATSLGEVLREHASVGPDGIRLLSLGGPVHAGEGCLCGQYAAVDAVMDGLGSWPETLAVIDMEASPEHMSRGTARHADFLLLVAEPYFRSLESVARLARLAGELPVPEIAVVANKVRSSADSEVVRSFCDRHGIRHLGDVPWSEEVVDADRQGIPLVEASPDSPVVAAIWQVAPHLRADASRT